MLRSVAILLLCVVLTTLGATAATPERRVALVIGNSQYKMANISLVNPRNDAQDVASVLRNLGFEVILATDSSKRDMDVALANFARTAVNADSALFYYAGHAMQYGGRNYLMPVDAELEDEISLRYNMIQIDDVRSALDRASGVKIMILDACRNNPLADRFMRNQVGQTRSVSMTRGLARIDKTQGMVVAYATAADDVALDGSSGRNSPFTTALLKRLQEPGLEIEMMFRRIAADVNAQTGGRQRPETYISLLSEYYLNQSDRLVWERLRDSEDIMSVRDFITRYPYSVYAWEAKHRLELLERGARERELQERVKREREIAEHEAAQRREIEEKLARLEAERRESDKAAAEQEAIRRRQEQEQLARAEAERAKTEREAAERAEAQRRQEQQRLAKIEADRQEAARVEAERVARAQAERAKAEKEAAERAEAQRRQEQERLAKVEADRREAARAEAERLARADAERAKAQREQAEREQAEKQRQAAEKLAKLEAERVQAQREAAEREAARQRELAERQKAEQACKQERTALNDVQGDAEKIRSLVAKSTCGDVAAVAKQRLAALDLERQRTQETCQREDKQLTLLQSAGPGGRDRLAQFEHDLACEDLRPKVLAALESIPKADAPAVPPSASPEEQLKLTVETQMELQRIGCLSTAADSSDLKTSTARGLKRYLSQIGHGSQQALISPELLQELKDHRTRVCPLVCPSGQVVEGERCSKPAPAVAKHPREEKKIVERHPAKATGSVEDRPAQALRPEPARPTASAGSPSHASPSLGVGF